MFLQEQDYGHSAQGESLFQELAAPSDLQATNEANTARISARDTEIARLNIELSDARGLDEVPSCHLTCDQYAYY